VRPLTYPSIWILSASCALLRLLLFVALNATQSHDAQWQLTYWPLWVIDFPISLVYLLGALPVPAAEAVLGPIWWFLMPLTLLSLLRKRKQRSAHK
jgi:uncharacterized protein (DUF2062 family)